MTTKLSFGAVCGVARGAATEAAMAVWTNCRLFIDSPDELKTELGDPGVTRAPNLPDKCDVDIHIRRVELSMIEEVEELRAKLNAGSFRQASVLQERNIIIMQPRNFDDIPSGVSKRAEGSRLKAGSLEVAIYRAVATRQVSIATAIRPLEGKSANIRAIARYSDAEEIAGHEACDEVRRPPAEDRIDKTTFVIQELFAGPERQLPNSAGGEPVAHVEVRIAAIIAKAVRILMPRPAAAARSRVDGL